MSGTTETEAAATAEVAEGSEPGSTLPEGYDKMDVNPSDLLVKVKVDGEEYEVTLDEAAKGYMRQQAFTRKTQEASQKVKEAEEALRLQRALRANPAATLALLAEHHGVRLASEDNDDYEDVDPRLVQMQSKLDQVTNLLNQQAFDREIAQLQTTFGEDVDVEAVVQHAQNGRFPSLRAAAADLLIDDALPVYRQHAQREQKNQMIVGLKRQVAVAAPGSGPSEPPTGHTTSEGSNRLSVREAAALAREGKTVKRWSPDDWKKPKR